MRKLFIVLATAIIVFVFFGCQKKNPQVTIELAKDENQKIVIELFEKDAPNTVSNFLKLVNQNFYNGITFHRVVPGFVAQGGDPSGNGTGGPGYTIKFESSDRKHIVGAIAMARKSSPDSAGSQFYICLAPQPSLDGKYTVFGQVISGMEAVNSIQRGDIMKKVYVSCP